MAILVRSGAQTRSRTRLLQAIVTLAMACTQLGHPLFAGQLLALAGFPTALFLVGPRRDWSSGMTRCSEWSFENMYSEQESWQQMRFKKHQVIELYEELGLPSTLTIPKGDRFIIIIIGPIDLEG